MNKSILLFIVVMLLIAYNTQSQINLENEYSSSLEFAYLEGNYYYSVDYYTNQCMIYNLSHDLVKTIDIQIPPDLYLNDIAFVSSNIFNEDDLIELLVVFYNYVPLGDTTGYYVYTTRVVDENSTILLEVPDGGYSAISQTSQNEKKLIVYKYDFSVFPFIYTTNVYGLPGVQGSSVNENPDVLLQNAYPNPGSSEVNIPYQINSAGGGIMLIITNMNGQEVKRVPIEKSTDHYKLNTSKLLPGQYLYHIQTQNNRTVARKIIVR